MSLRHFQNNFDAFQVGYEHSEVYHEGSAAERAILSRISSFVPLRRNIDMILYQKGKVSRWEVDGFGYIDETPVIVEVKSGNGRKNSVRYARKHGKRLSAAISPFLPGLVVVVFYFNTTVGTEDMWWILS